MTAPGPLLAGRVALVTGGGGGIGRAISEAFAAHGARVILAEIDEGRAAETVAAITEAGGEASASVVDVRDEAAVQRMAAATGAVDVLVNNVGHYLPGDGNFLTSTSEEWRELYRVNL
jgi:NAD(P)-dependent dehydrogenase (short-subunit alcohol dehydrogenase family)